MTSADDSAGARPTGGISPAAVPPPASRRRRGRALAACLAVAAASAAVLPCAAPAAARPPVRPAAKPAAKPSPKPSGRASRRPAPPERMSAVGGELLGLPGVQVRPLAGAPELPKEITGLSWIVSDATTGEVLASRNAHWRLPPASTLKMLFADTVLPRVPRHARHVVEPEELADMGEGSSLVGIKEHLEYRVEDLWRGVFLRSGNDAVHVLSHMNGGVAKTVRDMQARADALQADDTHVVSPDGYDAPGQVSSAYDLTLFARDGLRDPDFRSYCSTRTASFPGDVDPRTHKRQSFEIQNTDRLLTGAWGMTPYPGLIGVKNGFTSNAGNTFTGAAVHGGHTLIVTVMHPEPVHPNQVYLETGALLDWGFSALGRVEPVGALVGPRTAGAASPAPAGTGRQARPGPGAGAGAAAVQAGSTDGVPTGWVAGGIAAVLAAGGWGLARGRARARRRAAWAAAPGTGSGTGSATGGGSTAAGGGGRTGSTAVGGRRRRRLPRGRG
ncbi:D-alanyl-D-alanine carboxypeptidase family protein [Streptacidiphilus sp. ASG 303]|uniref:D-alanyl-D-alanine carboxypeptidase family protein n=1 Tax=Streptacidiphilus sp. ASG 303 TaxID=2896847 RepID=UPI0035AE2D90